MQSSPIELVRPPSPVLLPQNYLHRAQESYHRRDDSAASLPRAQGSDLILPMDKVKLSSNSATEDETNVPDSVPSNQNTSWLMQVWQDVTPSGPIRLSRYGKISLLAIIIQSILIIILESIVAKVYNNIGQSFAEIQGAEGRSVFVYLILFILSQLFSVFLVVDALLNENTIQVLSFLFFNLCCFLYAVFQVTQVASLFDAAQSNNELSADSKKAFESVVFPCLLLMPIFLGLAQLGHCWLGFQLYLEFGWRIYKKIGADRRLISMYRSFQIFITLLKLDVFFLWTFTLQYLVLALESVDIEYGLTIAVLPLTIIFAAFAVHGLQREQRVTMIGVMITCLLGMAYFLFKLIRFHVDPIQADKVAGTRRFLTFFGVLALVSISCTLANAIICYRNFGKGIRSRIEAQRRGPAERTLTL